MIAQNNTFHRTVYLGSGDFPGKRARRETFESYVVARPALFSVVTERHETYLVFDEKAQKPTLGELASELATDWGVACPERGVAGPATLELVAATLVKGEQWGVYGSCYWAEEEDTVHLLSCGADWRKFRGVTSERWTEWGGTFGEDTYQDRLEVALTCRCDEEVEVKFGLEPPSLAKLIVTLSAGQLEVLFEND